MCKYVNSKIFVVLQTYLIYLLSSFYLPQYCWTVLCLVAQSCPTLWNPLDCSPPGSSVHGILQARILEWVAVLSSRGSFWPRDWTSVSCLLAAQVLLWKWKSLSCVGLFGSHGSPWNSPGQNTGVGSLSLLQGIFPTQGLKKGLPHCKQTLYQLNHKESLRILECIAYPFSRGSSQPRNQTRVSCIAGWCFTNWNIREAQSHT